MVHSHSQAPSAGRVTGYCFCYWTDGVKPLTHGVTVVCIRCPVPIYSVRSKSSDPHYVSSLLPVPGLSRSRGTRLFSQIMGTQRVAVILECLHRSVSVSHLGIPPGAPIERSLHRSPASLLVSNFSITPLLRCKNKYPEILGLSHLPVQWPSSSCEHSLRLATW